MANPSHRHQSSLEGLIDFSAQPLFATVDERTRAIDKFHRIVRHYEAKEPTHGRNNQYNRPALVRLTFEYARSPESQDKFLQAFFNSMALGMEDDGPDLGDDEVAADFHSLLYGFADYLLDHFFLPCLHVHLMLKPSPIYHAAIQRVQGQEEHIQSFMGTLDRVSELRSTCLVRDRHRCVITRQFDSQEATERWRQSGSDAKDDDGNMLVNDIQPAHLEVAHILPHSLTKMGNNSQLYDDSRKAALSILNMFDNGVIHLIEGTDIDRPRNAITLSHDMHQHFGGFRVFFEPVPDGPPHTYRIGTFLPLFIVGNQVPVTRSFFNHPTIDPPSPRLLAVHSAIAHILHLSAAGDYIETILKDMEEKMVREDGSTQLGRLVTLGLLMSG
ncbi:hypothetical protein QBC46DRAFT_304165 [Diplogelasinospora grovesii]|uniref:HNH nuclease domain-containing protein n=1 Tax=Diplogelasinospora grovesii TaxID=303347 RepID=A0AAN6NFY8_9PEZI|nr:hypothetical protein QBC46DRAFT_304165 [Diplogelasinospora grovesii]